MSSIWGKNIKVGIFGESHGSGIGVTMDNMPSGFEIDHEKVRNFMQRRSSNGLPWATKRKEEDIPEIISGLYKGKTTGTPICAIIRNTDVRSSDYEKTAEVPRPGHADLTAYARYKGFQDPRGGGHFSGRLTAALVFAGAICKQILEEKNIYIFSHILSISNIKDKNFNSVTKDFKELRHLKESTFPVIDSEISKKMIEEIMRAKSDHDSCGGKIECMAAGVPAGIGSPIFEGIESKIASIMFSIPAVKGVEFGLGFKSSEIRGSDNNDSPHFDEEKNSIFYGTNNAGGIEGGITNGMPIVCTVAFKPTPSISKQQQSINIKTRENTEINITGRHDPCIVPRACVVVEAAMAIALLDTYFDFYPRG